MNRRTMMMLAKKQGGTLPDEYQQVEYIWKSSSSETATAYINTGIIPDNETGVLYDVALDPYAGDNNTDGARDNSGGRFTFGRYNNGIFVGWGSSYKTYQFSPSSLQRISVKCNYMNDRNASVDGVVFWSGLGTRPANNLETYLLGTNQGAGNIYWGSNAERIYGATYTQGSAIVRNFVPCYRKADGVVGLYDTVTKTFFYSPRAVLWKGADVN